MAQQKLAEAPKESLGGVVRDNFKSVDQDCDGLLTESEISKALKSKGLSVNQKAALQTLRGKTNSVLRAKLKRPHAPGLDMKGVALLTQDEGYSGRAINLQFSLEQELQANPVDPDSIPSEPADLTDKIGAEDYYVSRYKDFRRRNPESAAPTYLLDYGDKYFTKFHDQKESMSPVSQEWLTKTGEGLHKAIEDKRADNPLLFAELEKNDKAFRTFAYDSHPSVYVNSGLTDVPLVDRIKVARTPQLTDLLTLGGIKQVVETGVRVTIQDSKKWVKLLASKAVNQENPNSGNQS